MNRVESEQFANGTILLWPETGNPTRTPLAVKTNKNKACWQRGRNSFITKVGVSVFTSVTFWLEEIIFFVKEAKVPGHTNRPVNAKYLKSHSKPPKK